MLGAVLRARLVPNAPVVGAHRSFPFLDEDFVVIWSHADTSELTFADGTMSSPNAWRDNSSEAKSI